MTFEEWESLRRTDLVMRNGRQLKILWAVRDCGILKGYVAMDVERRAPLRIISPAGISASVNMVEAK